MANRPELTCRFCGKKFLRYLTNADYQKHLEGYLLAYCSRTCRGLAERNGMNKNCEACGKEFYVKLRDIKQRFCSPSCTSGWRKIAYLGKGNSNWSDALLCTCVRCGKQLRAKTYDKRKYCSDCLPFARVQAGIAGQLAVPKKDTSIERTIETWLRTKDIDYQKQVPFSGIGTVDFLVNTTVIECDGIYWHTQPGAKERDLKRDAALNALGYTVIRLSDKEIEKVPLDRLLGMKSIIATLHNQHRVDWLPENFYGN